MYHWMFNCKEVTRMVSESLDRELPLHQRVGIRIHLLMCRFCSRYRDQLLLLREAMRLQAIQIEEMDSSITLPEEAKYRMKEVLKRS
ncbi:MAG: zf-HC2 domain-containing protein [Desulfobacteraceae bacterium]